MAVSIRTPSHTLAYLWIPDLATNLCQMLLHHLWTVVDGKDDICHTSSGQGLNLVQDHALVAEFDQGLGQCEGLVAE